jgi:hypothetical protein
MTDLEKFVLVNGCENAEALSAAITSLSDENGNIKGRSRTFSGTKMASYVPSVISGSVSANCLTREFGIRQQAIYIKYYQ